jgi:hypothetical protein
VSEQAGPYDSDKCHFCGKSGKNGVKHTAGFQRRETYAGVGPWFDACQSCAEKPYEQPAQFQKTEENPSQGF